MYTIAYHRLQNKFMDVKPALTVTDKEHKNVKLSNCVTTPSKLACMTDSGPHWSSVVKSERTLYSTCMLQFLPEPPVQSHGTDGPPALVQAVAGLLQGIALRLSAAGSIFIAQQNIAQTEHRRDALRVLLDVPLQLLDGHQDRHHISPRQWNHVLKHQPADAQTEDSSSHHHSQN